MILGKRSKLNLTPYLIYLLSVRAYRSPLSLLTKVINKPESEPRGFQSMHPKYNHAFVAVGSQESLEEENIGRAAVGTEARGKLDLLQIASECDLIAVTKSCR